MADAKAMAAAISRILDVDPPSTAQKEAFRLKCHIRTIEKAVAAEKVKRGLPAAPPPGVRPVPGPPPSAGSPAGGGEKSPIDKVKEAAGGGAEKPPAGGGAPPPPPPDPKADGKKRDAEFAVREIGRLKGVAVALGGVAVGIPIDDPILEEEAELSGMAKNAIEDSAEEVAEYLRAKTGGGPVFLLSILAIDVIASALALWRRKTEVVKTAGPSKDGRPPIKKEIEGKAEAK